MDIRVYNYDDHESWYLQVAVRYGFKQRFLSLGGSAWNSKEACEEEFNRLPSLEPTALNMRNGLYLDYLDSKGNLINCKLISKENGLKLVGLSNFDESVALAQSLKKFAIGNSRERLELLKQ